MNIESKLWKIVTFNDGYAIIIQKASGVSRTVSRGNLPSLETISAAHELTFNRICREAFHT